MTEPIDTPHPLEAALVAGATLRLTRLVVTDDLGEWWIKEPAHQAAMRTHEQHGAWPWWNRYRDGLYCPHCVGFWIGAGVLTVTAATRGTRLARPWRAVMGALTLSYATGHLSAKID